jgi:hypothetical protein
MELSRVPAGTRSASDPPAPASHATALPQPAFWAGQSDPVAAAIGIVRALPRPEA